MKTITEKDLSYLGVARAIGAPATCIRAKVGAVIVKNDQIVGTGYAGAPRKRVECKTLGKCYRMENSVPHGADYALCRSIHAETNACLHAGRERALGGTLYLYGYARPCFMCARVMINAGIARIVVQENEAAEPTVILPEDLEYEPPAVSEWVKIIKVYPF